MALTHRLYELAKEMMLGMESGRGGELAVDEPMQARREVYSTEDVEQTIEALKRNLQERDELLARLDRQRNILSRTLDDSGMMMDKALSPAEHPGEKKLARMPH